MKQDAQTPNQTTASDEAVPASAAIQQQQIDRENLERWAADRVQSWGRELQTDDYDFRSWAGSATKNCLQAGGVYEWARQSRRLRVLLVLMDPKRPRKDWEIARPALINGRKPEPDEINSYPVEATWLPCSFENLDEHDAERALGGFLYCLRDLVDYLADNISFGALFRSKPDQLEKAFGGLDELSRAKREFRYFLPVIDAANVATLSEVDHVTTAETIFDEEKRAIYGETYSEVIAIRIPWRFTDREIAMALKKLVRALRPRSEAYKPRQPKKGSRRDSVRSALDCLSAMRLASYFPKILPNPTPGALSAWLSGDSTELKKSAIELFTMIRLGGRKDTIHESNFDALITNAHKLFKESFPFGEDGGDAFG